MFPPRGRLTAELRLCGFFDRLGAGLLQCGLDAVGEARVTELGDGAGDALAASLILSVFHQIGEDDLAPRPELETGAGGSLVARFRESLPVYGMLATLLGEGVRVELEVEFAAFGSGRARSLARIYRPVRRPADLGGGYDRLPPDLDEDAADPWRQVAASLRARLAGLLAAGRLPVFAEPDDAAADALRFEATLDRLRIRPGERCTDLVLLGTMTDPTTREPVPLRLDLRADADTPALVSRVLLRDGRGIITVAGPAGLIGSAASVLIGASPCTGAVRLGTADLARLGEGERVEGTLVALAPVPALVPAEVTPAPAIASMP